MDEVCSECGKTISRRAKANVWQGERVVCTACYNGLTAEAERPEKLRRIGEAMAGRAGSRWLVDSGGKQLGPYTTEQMIALLTSGGIDWMWNVWREGMNGWKKAANLFTIPELSNGRVELRDFRQGDGTYLPPGG